MDFPNTTDMYHGMDTGASRLVEMFLWKNLAPAIILLGTLGNVLTILTMKRKPLISTVTSPCLICLAIVDTIVLNTGLMRYWIMYISGADLRNLTDIGCKLHRFVVYWSIRMAAWILVLLSVERFISICLSPRFKVLCTRRNTFIAMLILGTVAGLVDVHVFWTTGLQLRYDNSSRVEYYDCNFKTEYRLWAGYLWPWTDFILASLLPFVLLLGCNIGIVSLLINTHRLRGRLHANSTDPKRTRRSNVKLTSMTITLILCSVSFFVLTAPISIYLIIEVFLYDEDHTPSDLAAMDFSWAIVNMLFYTNSSINFFLYTISASRFRREFLAFTTCSATSSTSTTVPQSSRRLL